MVGVLDDVFECCEFFDVCFVEYVKGDEGEEGEIKFCFDVDRGEGEGVEE